MRRTESVDPLNLMGSSQKTEKIVRYGVANRRSGLNFPASTVAPLRQR
jgi:hypothetical protein